MHARYDANVLAVCDVMVARGSLLMCQFPSYSAPNHRWIRHPAYCGWLIWSVGTQVLLVNPVCILAFTAAVGPALSLLHALSRAHMLTCCTDAIRGTADSGCPVSCRLGDSLSCASPMRTVCCRASSATNTCNTGGRRHQACR